MLMCGKEITGCVYDVSSPVQSKHDQRTGTFVVWMDSVMMTCVSRAAACGGLLL